MLWCPALSKVTYMVLPWAGLDPSNDPGLDPLGFTYLLSPLFELHSRYVFTRGAFVGQGFQSKAETFLFPFLEPKYPVHPTIIELQAKTWRNVLDTDDDDADCCQAEPRWSIPIGEAEFV